MGVVNSSLIKNEVRFHILIFGLRLPILQFKISKRN